MLDAIMGAAVDIIKSAQKSFAECSLNQ
jgi:hypothetical protein